MLKPKGLSQDALIRLSCGGALEHFQLRRRAFPFSILELKLLVPSQTIVVLSKYSSHLEVFCGGYLHLTRKSFVEEPSTNDSSQCKSPPVSMQEEQ